MFAFRSRHKTDKVKIVGNMWQVATRGHELSVVQYASCGVFSLGGPRSRRISVYTVNEKRTFITL